MLDTKTKPVIEILKRVVASAYVKNPDAYPLSCMLCAPVGAGKTTALKRIWGNGMLGLSDITPYGLCKLLPEIKAKQIHHIIIFDLVQPMSRSRSIVNPLIGFLNSLIEEGIFRISTAFITIEEPIRLGLITSTTRRELFDKRRGWLSIGFISRMLPVSWRFAEPDVVQILVALASGQIEEIKPEEIRLRARRVEGNPQVALKLIPYAQLIDKSASLGEHETYPFRRQKQLMIFLMANALLRGAAKVEERDFEDFLELSKWINWEFNPL
jgi:hypothetical protein